VHLCSLKNASLPGTHDRIVPAAFPRSPPWRLPGAFLARRSGRIQKWPSEVLLVDWEVLRHFTTISRDGTGSPEFRGNGLPDRGPDFDLILHGLWGSELGGSAC